MSAIYRRLLMSFKIEKREPLHHEPHDNIVTETESESNWANLYKCNFKETSITYRRFLLTLKIRTLH